MRLRSVLAGLLLMLMTACSDGASRLPTLVAFPTETPSITPSPTATLTYTPSATPTQTLTPRPTMTYTPTVTYTPSPTITNTPFMTRTTTPYPTLDMRNLPAGDFLYSRRNNLSIYACPFLDCAIIGQLSEGQAMEIIRTDITGESISGNSNWLLGIYNRQAAYVHASTMTPVNSSNGQNFANPLVIPSSNSNIQFAPANSEPENCAEAIAMGLSAREAAQYPHLDFDRDGVACYGD